MAQLQVLQLGVSGAESTLPTKSRTFIAHNNEEIALVGRSANGTLHTDFIARKRSWSIRYNVITQTTKDLLETIYLAQFSSGFLSFIITQDDGVATNSYTVKMAPPSFGALIPKSEFLYAGTSVELQEV